MNRLDMISRLRSESFDVAIIGGGATGLGIAVDSASRGYRTALLEAHDFAKATSSRSTKLVHGGVRYLEQLDLSLVTEALRERGIMCRNAPHLVSNLAFVIPQYKWWEGPFYGVGMKFYDALAGELNIEKSTRLNRAETIAAIPNVQQEGLLGGIKYHDGQFDDARMAVTLAATAVEQGAAIANYIEVTDFMKEDGAVVGLVAKEAGSQEELRCVRRWSSTQPVFSQTECGKWMTRMPTRKLSLHREFILCSIVRFCAVTVPSWCLTPTMVACCLSSPGTIGFWWVPPIHPCSSRNSNRAHSPRKSNSSSEMRDATSRIIPLPTTCCVLLPVNARWSIPVENQGRQSRFRDGTKSL